MYPLTVSILVQSTHTVTFNPSSSYASPSKTGRRRGRTKLHFGAFLQLLVNKSLTQTRWKNTFLSTASVELADHVLKRNCFPWRVGHGLAGDFCSKNSLQKVISFVVPRLGEDVFMAMATQCPAGEHLFFFYIWRGQPAPTYVFARAEHKSSINSQLGSWPFSLLCSCNPNSARRWGTVPRNP